MISTIDKYYKYYMSGSDIKCLVSVPSIKMFTVEMVLHVG